MTEEHWTTQIEQGRPPEVIDSVDVEMYVLTGPMRFADEDVLRQPPGAILWDSPNGQVVYYRWVSDDGEHYLRSDIFQLAREERDEV